MVNNTYLLPAGTASTASILSGSMSIPQMCLPLAGPPVPDQSQTARQSHHHNCWQQQGLLSKQHTDWNIAAILKVTCNIECSRAATRDPVIPAARLIYLIQQITEWQEVVQTAVITKTSMTGRSTASCSRSLVPSGRTHLVTPLKALVEE
jgi:hypothetical protein